MTRRLDLDDAIFLAERYGEDLDFTPAEGGPEVTTHHPHAMTAAQVAEAVAEYDRIIHVNEALEAVVADSAGEALFELVDTAGETLGGTDTDFELAYASASVLGEALDVLKRHLRLELELAKGAPAPDFRTYAAKIAAEEGGYPIGFEAACLKCGEHFNPSGDELVTVNGFVEHYVTEAEEECGGYGPLVGSWR